MRRMSLVDAGVVLAVLGASSSMAAPPQLIAGMTVSDAAGGQVGTIDSVTADGAVIATGTHKVALPLASFGAGTKGPVIGMTKVELDAAAEKASANTAAALRAQILPGVAVAGSQGNNLGTVKAVEGEYVILATANGDAKLPITSVGSGPKGLMIGMSADDFHAAVGKSQ